MADSNEAPRKTLDEIRSELAAEYPVASQTEEDPIGASDDAVIAVEQVRSAGRHRERRRRYAMAAVFVGITASLLLIAGHALRREPAPVNRRASTPDLSAPSAAPGRTGSVRSAIRGSRCCCSPRPASDTPWGP